MASSKVILYKSNKKKDGTCPIVIRITKDRKPKYINLNVCVKEDEWDEIESRVKKSHSNAARINNLILKKLTEVDDILIEANANNREISTTQVRKTVKRGGKGVSFFELAKERNRDYINMGKHGVAGSDNARVNNFRSTLLSSGIAHFSNGAYNLGVGRGFKLNAFKNSFEKTAGEEVQKKIDIFIAQDNSTDHVNSEVKPLPGFVGFKHNSFAYGPNLDIDKNNLTNKKEVEQVKNNLMNNPDYNVSLTGGASSEGNPAANTALSQDRINTVLNKLTGSGVDASRISGIPEGSTHLRSTAPEENTKENESVNRNVQIKYEGPPR